MTGPTFHLSWKAERAVWVDLAKCPTREAADALAVRLVAGFPKGVRTNVGRVLENGKLAAWRIGISWQRDYPGASRVEADLKRRIFVERLPTMMRAR